MRSAYVAGFWGALRRWPFAVLLFAATVAVGFGFAAMAWSWLSISLDSSLASRTLLTDLDPNVFIDLFAHHGESFWTLLQGGAVVALVFMLFGIWLNAGAVLAVSGSASAGEALRQGLVLYPIYLRLWVLATLLDAGAVAGAVCLGRVLHRWMAESPHEASAYWAIGAGTALALIVVPLVTTVHDHARVHCAASGKGALRGFAWAVWFTLVQERRAVPLTYLLLASGMVIWGAYQGLATFLPATSAAGVVLSIACGETLLLARMILRLWTFSAVLTLQQSHNQPTPWHA